MQKDVVSVSTHMASYRQSQAFFLSLAGQDRNDDTAAIISMSDFFRQQEVDRGDTGILNIMEKRDLKLQVA